MPESSDSESVTPRSGPRSGIFIAYRRSDSQPWSARLASDLRNHFGREYVYHDLDSNLPGQEYVVKIERWLSNVRVVIVVIGPGWISGPPGHRRLDDPADLHRREIEMSLTSGAFVLPVVVGGADMVGADALPDSIRGLAGYQSAKLVDDDWDFYLTRLLDALADRGVRSTGTSEPQASEGWTPMTTRKFSRKVRGTRHRTFDAALVAATELQYPNVTSDGARGILSFSAIGRTVTVRVVDLGRGSSEVEVQLPIMKAGALGGGSVAAGLAAGALFPVLFVPAAATLPLVRVWEKRFVGGFIDNVEAKLDGRPLVADSALLPGVERWRKGVRRV